jgi:hypothetical protein
MIDAVRRERLGRFREARCRPRPVRILLDQSGMPMASVCATRLLLDSRELRACNASRRSRSAVGLAFVPMRLGDERGNCGLFHLSRALCPLCFIILIFCCKSFILLKSRLDSPKISYIVISRHNLSYMGIQWNS